ncbi:MAG: ferrous iron transport protein B, partial [Verrucomicrobiae bacterium]|nr:ferrous iron transport protein B [Verrucomicrobiae bacterium]
LLIAACIPDRKVLGPVRLPGLTLLGLYVLGVVVAFALAWVSKKTILKSHLPLMILELPPYRRPALGALLRHVWERVRSFLQRAGTVILGINILLWFLASYPRNSDVERSYAIQRQQLIAQAGVADGSPTPGDTELQSKLRELENQLAGERLRGSFVGRLGRVIEPLIAPLGFDWKIGIGILSSFAARELFVSTIAVVYNVGSARTNEGPVDLVTTLRAQKRPDGTPVYSLPTGLALLVFYAIALQCAGTLTIIYRETNSLKWTLVDLVCLGTIAWLLAFAAYNGARALGWQ